MGRTGRIPMRDNVVDAMVAKLKCRPGLVNARCTKTIRCEEMQPVGMPRKAQKRRMTLQQRHNFTNTQPIFFEK